jgi:hypothetical protein
MDIIVSTNEKKEKKKAKQQSPILNGVNREE